MATSKTVARSAKKSPTKKKSAAKKSAATARPQVSCKDRILQAIASRIAFGDMKPNRDMIMGMAAMTSKKSFSNLIPTLKKKHKWVDYDSTSIWLTDEGKDYVGPDILAVPANNDAMYDKIRNDMIDGGRPRLIFDLMLDGGWHSKDELAAAMNLPLNKSFTNNISKLSKVIERKNGKVRLSDMVFPCGRPSA